MKLFYDNEAAISIFNILVLHDEIKQVEIHKHFIKGKFEDGVICVPFLPTTRQIAGIFISMFTKGYIDSFLTLFVSMLAMIHILTWRGVSENIANDMGCLITWVSNVFITAKHAVSIWLY